MLELPVNNNLQASHLTKTFKLFCVSLWSFTEKKLMKFNYSYKIILMLDDFFLKLFLIVLILLENWNSPYTLMIQENDRTHYYKFYLQYTENNLDIKGIVWSFWSVLSVVGTGILLSVRSVIKYTSRRKGQKSSSRRGYKRAKTIDNNCSVL